MQWPGEGVALGDRGHRAAEDSSDLEPATEGWLQTALAGAGHALGRRGV